MTVLFFPNQPTKSIMEKDRTTCEFLVPPLVLSDSTSFWECRVFTMGGQDSAKFKVTVKGKKTMQGTFQVKALLSASSGKCNVIAKDCFGYTEFTS